VKNAEKGRNGKRVSTALFGYSNLLGSDQEFSAAETTGNRSLEFSDCAAEMFGFDVNVTAVVRGAGGDVGGAGAAPEGGGRRGKRWVPVVAYFRPDQEAADHS
jgi:hypothetical protein